MSFALSGWMLYMMWAVLGVIGLNLLAGIYQAFKSDSFSFSVLPNFLRNFLLFVLPLLLLANMAPLDPTGWLVKGGYLVGAVGVIIKYLIDVKNKLF
ncbi:hypothetical protein J2S00_001958 [Caldalkalibacillus uzonensis]|uniref:Uncharacterized protein n=1 Tax=Caldalkalibacillus uzonensis TaxID=353224 RepID=A0ABU0CRX6_9BACI|nr:hypothetical protein [Caldalkalibacillus uzonensis]MDQ0339172.1 hypothetical protein [Caldalkalibacillus uzonensis]